MKEKNTINVEANATAILGSILSKINMIYLCLPIDIQEQLENVKNNIISVLRELKCNAIVLNEKEQLTFLDQVSLFTIFNSISEKLGICLLFFPNNVRLEDAFYDIQLIMEQMSKKDSVFGWCYKSRLKKFD